MIIIFFFFNDTATTEIYTLSLHDALPILWAEPNCSRARLSVASLGLRRRSCRSEEHTSELQSPCNLVCRLLLEKKKYLRLFVPPFPISLDAKPSASSYRPVLAPRSTVSMT